MLIQWKEWRYGAGGSGSDTASAVDMTTLLGTPKYMAPEQVHDKKYSYPVDVWAFGVTLIRLFTLKSPYEKTMQDDRIMQMVAIGVLRPRKVQFSDCPHKDVLEVINDCVQFKAKEIPTFKEITRRLNEALERCQRERGEMEM